MTIDAVTALAKSLARRAEIGTHGSRGGFSYAYAATIIDDPQKHIDALVDAGVLRKMQHVDTYLVVPPACPTCGKR